MENKRIIDPAETETKDLHQFLLGIVAPRPIAFASTLNDEGQRNLAPFSFFNAYSSNPPTVVFSSNRRVRNNTTKHTLHNVQKTGEVVINAVTHDILRQMALTSVEFPEDVDEFEKAGLTPLPADLVKPYRVAESPANMECKVKDIITLGEHGGAGHLIICDILRIHLKEDVITDRNRIDPHKMDLMGRMGRAYYCRASGDAIHTVVQPVTRIAVGFDGLPESIRKSEILTGNEIGRIAGLESLPPEGDIDKLKENERIQKIRSEENDPIEGLHLYAKTLIAEEEIEEAAKVLLYSDRLTKFATKSPKNN